MYDLCTDFIIMTLELIIAKREAWVVASGYITVLSKSQSIVQSIVQSMSPESSFTITRHGL